MPSGFSKRCSGSNAIPSVSVVISLSSPVGRYQPEIPEFLKKVEEGMTSKEWDDFNTVAGTRPYNDYQTYEEWEKEFDGYCGMAISLYTPGS